MAIAKFADVGAKLEGIQGKLDGISDLFENPFGNLAGNLLGGFEFPGGELPGAIGGVLNKIPSFPGLNLGFSGLGGFGDCFRNIDDLINEMLKQKLIELTLSIPPGMAAAALMSSVYAATEVIQEVIDDVISLSQESLMDLIIKVQNSSFLQRIIIIKKITDLYGEIICNINELIEKILDLDPCNLLEDLAGSGPPPGPKPMKMPDEDMAPFPTIIDPATANPTLLQIKDDYVDAKFRIGQALSKTNSDDPDVPPFVQSESHNAAMSTLHHLAHSFRNQVKSLRAGSGTLALNAIQESRERIVREKAAEWSKEALEFFEKKFDKLLLPALEESTTQFENFDTALDDPVAAASLPIDSLERTLVPESKDKCGPKEGEEEEEKAPPITSGVVPSGFVEKPKAVSPAPRKQYQMEVPPNVNKDLPSTVVIPEGGAFSGTFTRVQGSIYRHNETKDVLSYSRLQSMIRGAATLQRENEQRIAAGLPPRGR